MKYFKKSRKGITLVELILVLPLISIILITAYNVLFLSYGTFNHINDSFNFSEDFRIFQNNIQKESNQAKKSVEDMEVFHRIDEKELYIYTTQAKESIESQIIVRYRLMDETLVRDEKQAENTSYPYDFSKQPWKNEKVVLKNIKNTDIFGEVERITEDKSNHLINEKDHRRRVFLKLIMEKGKSDDLRLDVVIISKSRTEAE